MDEEGCPIKGCAPDDCEECYENNWGDCIYVHVWENIRSGEFKRGKGTPWKPEVRGSNRRVK